MKRPYLSEFDRLLIRLGTLSGAGRFLVFRIEQLKRAINKELQTIGLRVRSTRARD